MARIHEYIYELVLPRTVDVIRLYHQFDLSDSNNSDGPMQLFALQNAPLDKCTSDNDCSTGRTSATNWFVNHDVNYK